MKHTAPVYEYVCPRCLANMGDPCTRVRRIRRTVPQVLLNAHNERYKVWRAWEQPDLFDNVQKEAYRDVLIQTLESDHEDIRNHPRPDPGSHSVAAGDILQLDRLVT